MRFTRVLISGLLACFVSAHANEPADRVLVVLPDAMREHMLSNMRDHLKAISEIQTALGTGDFQRAADIAEQRIGLSSLGAHGAAHMAPFMPKEMQDIGSRMHSSASQFALVAQEAGADGNVQRAIGSLSAITNQCVACHAAFRVR
ncbi:hypothetical protein J5J83_03000 [Azoarcus sp. L1K30]|uniref:hypothetical protein n=1 Tax=Azoarcus sp. L1K30 TaxID=2820277 RepID=UPI001B82E402|nr:hypothetical protein [Azoarcus sp. L1K30]MBR0565083.1 hypothetical protein [Azoarcus sp. L1K30]